MDLWRSLSGMVILDLTSADVTESMRCINDSGIRIFGAVAKDALTMRFQIHRRDYRSLCRLCKVRGDRIQISGHRGIYWGLKGVLHRSVLLTGVMILLVASFWIPSRVFFVRVEGNQRIPQKVILEAAEACGLTFGADRSKVRSERMKNALLERIPELQWTGINTTGCTAVISVRERSETTTGEGRGGVSSIVASTDGVISELTVLRGTPLCRVGQAVKAGQILVSGYTDCGLTIRAEQAAAEIFAKIRERCCICSSYR